MGIDIDIRRDRTEKDIEQVCASLEKYQRLIDDNAQDAGGEATIVN